MKRVILACVLIGVFRPARAANYPTAPMPYQVLDTTKIVAVKIGEGVTTTAPTYAIAYQDVTETSTTAGYADGSFTTSFASACAAPAQGTRQISSVTICNIDTVSHTIYVQKAASGTPATATAVLLNAYTLASNATVILTVSGPVTSVPLALPVSVPNGGTGLTSGTSGGVPYYNSTTTMASSGALTANQIVLGGGAGSAPVPLGSLGTTTTVLHGNAGGAPTYGAVNLGTDVTGTLGASNGGTGQPSYAIGDLLSASASTTLTKIADVATGSYLRSGGVSTLPFWSTLLLPNSATTGDVFYASSTNTMGNLADVATGSVLVSGGVGAAPSYSSTPTFTATNVTGLPLTTGVTGTLPIANGGTASNAALSGGRPIISNASAIVESSGFQGVKTTDYTVVVGDGDAVIAGDNSGAGMTNGITLPQAGSGNKGMRVTIINVGASGSFKVTPNASDGIDGRGAGIADKLNASGARVTYRSTGTSGTSTSTGWVVESATDFLRSTWSAQTAPASGGWGSVTGASIVLTPGEWDITAMSVMLIGGGASATQYQIGVVANSTTTGNATTGDDGNQWIQSFTSANQYPLNIPGFRVTLSAATTTYSVNWNNTWATSAPTLYGRISARRVR